MKKIFLIIILLLTVVLVIDSITYLNNYNNSVQISEKFQQEGHEIQIPSHMDVFTKQNDYFRNGISVIIQFLYPLLLIIIGCVAFHKKIHSGFFKNIIVRENFKKYINVEILKSWKASLLIPLFVVITFLFSCIITQFNFDLNSHNSSGMILNVANERSIASETIKIILMTINLFIVSIACINVGLLFSKKNKNFIVSSVISYLVIIVYQIAAAIIVGPILSNIFNSDFFANGLTLFNFWHYDSGVTAINMFIYAILLLIITSYILKRTYENKENVVINAEK